MNSQSPTTQHQIDQSVNKREEGRYSSCNPCHATSRLIYTISEVYSSPIESRKMLVGTTQCIVVEKRKLNVIKKKGSVKIQSYFDSTAAQTPKPKPAKLACAVEGASLVENPYATPRTASPCVTPKQNPPARVWSTKMT